MYRLEVKIKFCAKFKESIIYLMIKTKSRSCKGVNSKQHPQNIGAGCDYNPALQNV